MSLKAYEGGGLDDVSRLWECGEHCSDWGVNMISRQKWGEDDARMRNPPRPKTELSAFFVNVNINTRAFPGNECSHNQRFAELGTRESFFTRGGREELEQSLGKLFAFRCTSERKREKL